MEGGVLARHGWHGAVPMRQGWQSIGLGVLGFDAPVTR
jgi:hypothetical protein